MPLFHKRKPQPIEYDPALRQPAVRQSICTGELTAGFIDRATGRFIELMRLDGRKEMEDFCQRVGVEIDEMKVIY